MTGQTNIDCTVEVAVDGTDSTTPTYHNTDLELAGFNALVFEELTNVGNVGDTNINDSFVDYPIYGSRLSVKQKGSSSGAEPVLECLQPKSGEEVPAYSALIAAGQTNSNVALRITWDDGHREFVRCLVGQPLFVKGQNSNFRIARFTLGINQSSIVTST
jgi:hypothetical protein